MRKQNVIYSAIVTHFPVISEAERLKDFLIKNEIPATTRQSFLFSKYFDKKAKFSKAFLVYVDTVDLSNAENKYDTYLEYNRDSYYLNNFNDEELIEILFNPHLWTDIDLGYAKKILTQRKKLTKEIEEKYEKKFRKFVDRDYYSAIYKLIALYVIFIIAFKLHELSGKSIVILVHYLLLTYGFSTIEVLKQNEEKVRKLHISTQSKVLASIMILYTIFLIWSKFN